jgi:hypothetical protein
MKMKGTGFGPMIAGLTLNRSINPVGECLVPFIFTLWVVDFTASTAVLKPRSRFLRRRLSNLVATANSAISFFRII